MVAVVTAALTVPAGPAAAAAGPAALAEAPVLTSGSLAVTVAGDFPRVLSCTDRATGARLLGSTRPVTAVTLNGTAHTVRLKDAPRVRAASAAYTLTFPGLPGVEIDATLSLSGRAPLPTRSHHPGRRRQRPDRGVVAAGPRC